LPITNTDHLVATETEGIFRLAGAERRIKELQSIFNSPERYGKGLDWTPYTVHDSANVLRRYLNQLPEPIIPLEFYNQIRAPLKYHQAEAVGEIPHQEKDIGGFDPDAAITTYQRLITELPPLNRQLLLYLLDLLAVFASKSEVNLMTSSNLAAIFQPGILSHPNHDMAPNEYRLSQDVLIFLIEHQDHFLVGMQGTAADEKTILDVQSGAPTPQKSPSTPDKALARSTSTASAGAESIRRFGNIRRNMSVSSKHSRQSNNASTPGTPPSGIPLTPGGSAKPSGVQRSKTVPSKKSPSPGLPSGRFRNERSPAPAAAVNAVLASPTITIPLAAKELTPPLPAFAEAEPKNRNASASSLANPPSERSPHLRPTPVHHQDRRSKIEGMHMEMPPLTLSRISPAGTPSKERTFSSIFKPSPVVEADRKDMRKSNKLQKKRPVEGSTTGQGSASSIGNSSNPGSPALPPTSIGPRGSISQSDGHASTASYRSVSNVQLSLDSALEDSPPFVPALETQMPSHTPLEPEKTTTTEAEAPKTLAEMPQHDSSATLRPTHIQSPRESFASHSSVNGYSSADNAADPEVVEETQKRRRWRLSSSSPKKNKDKVQNNRTLGSERAAGRSTSTVASLSRPRKSFTDDSNYSGNSAATQALSDAELSGTSAPSEKKGALGWFKGILQKDRGKSPQRVVPGEEGTSSLAAMVGGSNGGSAVSRTRQVRSKSAVSLKIDG